MQRTGTCRTADMQNQLSSIAIKASIIATKSCDISECGHVCGAHAIECYELYTTYLYACLTQVMLRVYVLFVRAHLF